MALSIQAISASGAHTCALKAAAAYCWGDNAMGQVGIPSEAERLGPTRVPGGDWVSIVAADRHSCALERTGGVRCWGANDRGQLGQGHREPLDGPTLVPLPAPAVQLAGGFQHSCALLDNSELWCWGNGNEGQLGRDDDYGGEAALETDALTPERVSLPDGSQDGWSFVDTGEGHTCALRLDGSLWCWGRNSQRQLGFASAEAQVRAPARVAPDTDWQSVNAAQNYTCALRVDGSLWCWGFNMGFMSQSGNPFGLSCEVPDDCLQLDQPTRILDGEWLSFSTNMFHTCAMDRDAQLWCWGRNHEGQLGMENFPDPQDPDGQLLVHLRTLVATDVELFDLGRFTTCVATRGGGLSCVGKNDRGQLGVGVGLSESEFVEVPLPDPLPAEAQ